MPHISLQVSDNSTRDSILEMISEHYCQCERCSDWHDNEESTSVVTDASGRHNHIETWCDYCANDTWSCAHCEETFSDDCEHTDIEGGDRLCERCYQNADTFTCENCGNTFYTSDMGDDETGCYCSECCSDRAPTAQNGIACYHSDPIRRSWSIPKGAISVEIECKAGRNGRDELATILREQCHCACETDGSLDSSRGIEVITKPLTWDVQRGVLSMLLSTIRANGGTAWDCGDGYGIHVNIDARTLESWESIAFCNMFNARNKTWLDKVAGRSTGWAILKPRDNETELPSGKYDACALKPGGRLEVRIFRSTLKTETAIGYVALCLDILRYVRSDPFRPVVGLLQWLRHNASNDTRALLESKLSADEFPQRETVTA